MTGKEERYLKLKETRTIAMWVTDSYGHRERGVSSLQEKGEWFRVLCVTKYIVILTKYHFKSVP